MRKIIRKRCQTQSIIKSDRLFSSSDGEYIFPEASDNGYDNDSDEEYQDGDTDVLEIGAHFKNPFFTNAENKSCLNGWITVNDL